MILSKCSLMPIPFTYNAYILGGGLGLGANPDTTLLHLDGGSNKFITNLKLNFFFSSL